jgi:hypothetical protein
MYVYKKHFTIDEARSYLSALRYKMSELIHLKQNLDQVGFNIYTRKYRPGFNPDTLTEFPDEFVQFMDQIQALQEDGVLVKGVDEGLADFPAIRENGEEVFLCWKVGEDDIYYWHTLDGGFRGRRPLVVF